MFPALSAVCFKLCPWLCLSLCIPLCLHVVCQLVSGFCVFCVSPFVLLLAPPALCLPLCIPLRLQLCPALCLAAFCHFIPPPRLPSCHPLLSVSRALFLLFSRFVSSFVPHFVSNFVSRCVAHIVCLIASALRVKMWPRHGRYPEPSHFEIWNPHTFQCFLCPPETLD